MSGLMSGESRQGIARTSKVAWLAAALVAVTLPTAVAQVAAGASASAVIEAKRPSPSALYWLIFC